MLVGIAAWAIKAAVVSPQIDPFSLMGNAKNLPSQELLNLKMWSANGVVRY